jgi:hypothetical protein
MSVKLQKDERLSNKFRWLSLLATWSVVCIHSRTDRWAVGTDDFAVHIEQNVADIFYFDVPLFSSYLDICSFHPIRNTDG